MGRFFRAIGNFVWNALRTMCRGLRRVAVWVAARRGNAYTAFSYVLTAALILFAVLFNLGGIKGSVPFLSIILLLNLFFGFSIGAFPRTPRTNLVARSPYFKNMFALFAWGQYTLFVLALITLRGHFTAFLFLISAIASFELFCTWRNWGGDIGKRCAYISTIISIVYLIVAIVPNSWYIKVTGYNVGSLFRLSSGDEFKAQIAAEKRAADEAADRRELEVFQKKFKKDERLTLEEEKRYNKLMESGTLPDLFKKKFSERTSSKETKVVPGKGKETAATEPAPIRKTIRPYVTTRVNKDGIRIYDAIVDLPAGKHVISTVSNIYLMEPNRLLAQNATEIRLERPMTGIHLVALNPNIVVDP